MTEKMAKTLEVKKGDTITVKGENGDKKNMRSQMYVKINYGALSLCIS